MAQRLPFSWTEPSTAADTQDARAELLRVLSNVTPIVGLLGHGRLNLPTPQIVGVRRRSHRSNTNDTTNDIVPDVEQYIVTYGTVNPGWNPQCQPADNIEVDVIAAAAWQGRDFYTCLMGYRAFEAQFSGVQKDIQSVEWHYCTPKPRFLISTRDMNITIPVNHFIVLRGRNGRDYVIDICARQFGFGDWFYPARDYEALIQEYKGQVNVYQTFQNASWGTWPAFWYPEYSIQRDYMFLKLLIDQVCMLVHHFSSLRFNRHITELSGDELVRMNSWRQELFEAALDHAIRWRRNALFGARPEDSLGHLPQRRNGEWRHWDSKRNCLVSPPEFVRITWLSPDCFVTHDMADPTMVWSHTYWSRYAHDNPDWFVNEDLLDRVCTANCQDFEVPYTLS